MNAFSYIVARDFGFAPNPFFGFCTLATCKPRIRAHATIGDWIIGTGAKGKYDLAGHLIYAMKVDEIIDFTGYWNDPRFVCKRPVLNGSLKQIYGDNIYHREGKRWIQLNSHHSHTDGTPNRENIYRDTSTDRVLVSRTFVYFGAFSRRIPQRFRHFGATGFDLCCSTQGHRKVDLDCLEVFIRWIDRIGRWGLQGLPLEFTEYQRKAHHPD